MKVALLCLGKTNKDYVVQGMVEFEKRLSRFCKFERVELKDVKKQDNPKILKTLEAEAIFEKLHSDDHLILLDEKGKRFSSRKFAEEIEKVTRHSKGRLVFVVAGAFGASEELKARAKLLLSLSDMTYSHQLIRLIFEEQLYRAFAILNNHPYHND